MSNPLPEGWICATLGDLAYIEMGQSPPGSETNSVGDGLPLIGGAADYEGDHLNPSRYTSAPTKVCQPRDFVLCVRATIGNLAQADTAYCLGRGVAGLRPIKVDNDWLRYLIRHDKQRLNDAGTGSTFRQIDKQTLTNWQVPLPPLAEQKRIVAKLDTLLGRTNRAKDELAHIPRLIERYRQGVLAAAFRGDLTVDWRRTTNLLGWNSSTIGDVIADLKYGTAKKCHADKGATPVLRIPNIGNGIIDLSNLKYADFTADERRSWGLTPGDILVIRSNGSLDLVGKAALVTDTESHCLYAGYLIRLRPNERVVSPSFLCRYLQGPDIRRRVQNVSKSTSGVNNINSHEIKGLPIHLPPLKEQLTIVERINEAFNSISNIEFQLNRAVGLVNRLEQATLVKAFRGELVSQDPADEPASVLLEHIQAARLSHHAVPGKKTESLVQRSFA